jgi:hypothetical protein
MGDNRNIFAGTQAAGADGTGLAWFAITGSTAPTDATTALAAAWKNAGLITDKGLTAKFSENSKPIRAYGSTAIQRTLVTDDTYTFDLEFLETNQYSQAVYHRLGITSITPGTGTGAYSLTSGTYARQLYAFTADMIDGSNHIRIYCPTVEVTGRSDVSFAAGSEATWGVTLTAYPNSSGVAAQWYQIMAALG